MLPGDFGSGWFSLFVFFRLAGSGSSHSFVELLQKVLLVFVQTFGDGDVHSNVLVAPSAAPQIGDALVIFFILRSILSDMKIATPAFFCFPFAWNIFSILSLSIYMCLEV